MYIRRFFLGLGVVIGCTMFVQFLLYYIDRGPNHTRNQSSSYQVPKKIAERPMEQPNNHRLCNNTDVYFSIKTTERYYEERLLLLMMTWFEVLENKVARA